MGYAFKSVAEQKCKIERSSKAEDDLPSLAIGMLEAGISSESIITRCLSAEAIGRLAQAVNDPQVCEGVSVSIQYHGFSVCCRARPISLP